MVVPRIKFTVFGPDLLELKGVITERGEKAIVQEILFPALIEAAEVYKKQIQDTIKTRGSASGVVLLPNARETLRKKSGDIPLINTGEYLRSFRVFRNKEKVEVTVGPKSGIHGPSGLPYELLGSLHESGFITPKGGVVPARPHVEPAFIAADPKINKIVAKAADKVAKKFARAFKQKKKWTR